MSSHMRPLIDPHRSRRTASEHLAQNSNVRDHPRPRARDRAARWADAATPAAAPCGPLPPSRRTSSRWGSRQRPACPGTAPGRCSARRISVPGAKGAKSMTTSRRSPGVIVSVRAGDGRLEQPAVGADDRERRAVRERRACRRASSSRSSMRKRYLPCFTFRYGQTLPFTRILSPKKCSIHIAGYLSEPSGWNERSWIASPISNAPEGRPSAFSTRRAAGRSPPAPSSR